VHPERFDDDALDAIQRVVQSPGTPRAALAYYRAAFRWPSVGKGVIHGTSLVLWGERDHALGTGLLDGLEEYLEHVLVHRIPDASHWVQQDAAEEVSDALLTFLT
jgi:pimeloyl-ACP methyl ester carboxylesterase